MCVVDAANSMDRGGGALCSMWWTVGGALFHVVGGVVWCGVVTPCCWKPSREPCGTRCYHGDMEYGYQPKSGGEETESLSNVGVLLSLHEVMLDFFFLPCIIVRRKCY